MVIETLSLEALLDYLDSYEERIPLNLLKSNLRALALKPEEIERYKYFSDENYQRNLIREGNVYHALLLCWLPGQRSPIHDHKGSSCGVRVIEGVGMETVFAQTEEGLVYPYNSMPRREKEVFGSQDLDIHQMSNLQASGKNLITLHVYSPPLLNMGVYSLTDSRVRECEDPIVKVEFLQGAGI